MWALTVALALDAILLVLDGPLIVASGARGTVVVASVLAGAALATFIALAAAPALAAIELACERVERTQRALWWTPIALAAWLAGAVVSSVLLQPTHAFDLGVVSAFAIAVVVCALLARARRGLPFAVATAAIAAIMELRLPIVRRDWRDMLALVVVFATLAALTGARRRIALAPQARRFVVLGCLVVASLGAMRAIDFAPPEWRAAATRRARMFPRLARAVRAAVDLDGDGFSAIAWGGDCDDADPQRNPRAHELPNGIDRNCNGTVRPASPTDSERGLAPPAGEPNVKPGDVDLVLLVTIDAWRSDSLRPDVMPNMTSLQARGLSMQRLYSAGTATRVTMRLALRPDATEESIATRLGRAGVATSAVFSFNRPELKAALHDGFAEVRMSPDERWNARETTDEALAILKKPEDRPRFVWVHYFDAHQPLIDVVPGVAPSYSDEVTFVDRELPRLLEAVPARSLVIVTADHGEAFDSLGVAYHALTAKEVLMHIPGIVTGPGIAPGTYGELTSTRDLVPTILGAFGRCDASAERFGRSWLRLRDAPTAPLHEFVVTYSSEAGRGGSYMQPMAAIVEGRFKLVETFESTIVEVYDPAADPEEKIDRATFDPAETARLRRRLALFRDIDGFL